LDYKIHRSFSPKSWTPGTFGMWRRKIGKETYGRCVSSGSTGEGDMLSEYIEVSIISYRSRGGRGCYQST
jgi:hypothetical protein